MTLPDFHKTVPEELTLREKTLLFAHILYEEGQVEWSLVLFEFLSSLECLSAATRLADILSEPPLFRDVSRAKLLYMNACAAGDSTACHNLAVLYDQLGEHENAERYYAAASSRDTLGE